MLIFWVTTHFNLQNYFEQQNWMYPWFYSLPSESYQTYRIFLVFFLDFFLRDSQSPSFSEWWEFYLNGVMLTYPKPELLCYKLIIWISFSDDYQHLWQIIGQWIFQSPFEHKAYCTVYIFITSQLHKTECLLGPIVTRCTSFMIMAMVIHSDGFSYSTTIWHNGSSTEFTPEYGISRGNW